MPPIKDYVRVANRYAGQVVSGKIPACRWVKLACQRQIDDLKRSKADETWPYRFDAKAAKRICHFVELMPHIKGEWAKRRERIRLEPWQVFILTTVFGWLHRETGLRRFRMVYEEVARKNAKSTKSAGVALYMLGPDGEAGAEIYSAATKKDQAKIVFDAARAMAMRSTEFRLKYGIEVFTHAIAVPATTASFKALDAKAQSQDGHNVHFVCNDEVHAHRTRDLYDVLETAMGARQQPLMWNITTAGTNRTGICYEKRTYVTKVLEGSFTDDTVFGIIFTVDDEDLEAANEARLYTDPELWRKANPNYGISVKPDDMERLAKQARETPSARVNFLTKRLNVWCKSEQAWMTIADWAACADPALKIEDFEGDDCWIGLDLASKLDINSKIRLFRRGGRYFMFATHYLPDEAIRDGVNSQYTGWAAQGWLTATPGNVVDYDRIEEDIAGDPDAPDLPCDAGLFGIKALGFDPHQAQHMINHLVDAGVECVEVRPTVLNFSEPLKELERLVKARLLVHTGDPVLAWMVSNVVVVYDRKDNIYPRKELPQNKIDGVVAACMALNRALADKAPVDVSTMIGVWQ